MVFEPHDRKTYEFIWFSELVKFARATPPPPKHAFACGLGFRWVRGWRVLFPFAEHAYIGIDRFVATNP